MTKWRDDINSKVVLPNGEQIPILLLANKCDLPDVTLDHDKLDEFVRANGFIGWYATSAQDNVNVDEAMKFLVAKILDVSQRVKVERPGLVPAHNTATLSVAGANPYTGHGAGGGGGGGGGGAGGSRPKDDGCCG